MSKTMITAKKETHEQSQSRRSPFDMFIFDL